MKHEPSTAPAELSPTLRIHEPAFPPVPSHKSAFPPPPLSPSSIPGTPHSIDHAASVPTSARPLLQDLSKRRATSSEMNKLHLESTGAQQLQPGGSAHDSALSTPMSPPAEAMSIDLVSTVALTTRPSTPSQTPSTPASPDSPRSPMNTSSHSPFVPLPPSHLPPRRIGASLPRPTSRLVQAPPPLDFGLASAQARRESLCDPAYASPTSDDLEPGAGERQVAVVSSAPSHSPGMVLSPRRISRRPPPITIPPPLSATRRGSSPSPTVGRVTARRPSAASTSKLTPDTIDELVQAGYAEMARTTAATRSSLPYAHQNSLVGLSDAPRSAPLLSERRLPPLPPLPPLPRASIDTSTYQRSSDDSERSPPIMSESTGRRRDLANVLLEVDELADALAHNELGAFYPHTPTPAPSPTLPGSNTPWSFPVSLDRL